MVSKMYKEMYSRWLAANLDDPDLKPELESIQNDDAAIQDRFAVALKFGTAGLRGVIGAGTNRMNVYVVRQATQGLANWVKTQGGTQTVAISYDSRIKSDVFAKAAAEVLAANGVKVRIYSALMPVPALSFGTRGWSPRPHFPGRCAIWAAGQASALQPATTRPSTTAIRPTALMAAR